MKGKIPELIEQTFYRDGSLYLVFNKKHALSLLNNLNDIVCGHVRSPLYCGQYQGITMGTNFTLLVADLFSFVMRNSLSLCVSLCQ